MRYLLFLTLPLYLLDQWTKWLVIQRFEIGESLTVIPGFFNLVHVTNTGAAFGMFSGNNLPFILLSLVAITAVVYLYLRGHLHDVWTRSACALLLTGILGNLTDRLRIGHVVDFLDFHLGDSHWPSFNVADSCICVAAALMILSSFLHQENPKEATLENEAN